MVSNYCLVRHRTVRHHRCLWNMELVFDVSLRYSVVCWIMRARHRCGLRAFPEHYNITCSFTSVPEFQVWAWKSVGLRRLEISGCELSRREYRRHDRVHRLPRGPGCFDQPLQISLHACTISR